MRLTLTLTNVHTIWIGSASKNVENYKRNEFSCHSISFWQICTISSSILHTLSYFYFIYSIQWCSITFPYRFKQRQRLKTCQTIEVTDILVGPQLLIVVTLGKSGGGFLPLHKFDKHHTAFLVIDSLVDLLNNLNNERLNLIKYNNKSCLLVC